jgi:hypothetical protein
LPASKVNLIVLLEPGSMLPLSTSLLSPPLASIVRACVIVPSFVTWKA